jgi:hypothetical protein
MTAIPLQYRSGEEIKAGDSVRFHGNLAEIEFLATDASDPDPAMAWYVKEFGGGIMVLDPLVSGRTFIHSDQLDDYEDLEFVSRCRNGAEDRRPTTEDQRLTTNDFHKTTKD